MKHWIDKFKTPETEYRALPFWSWNGKLTDEELRRQIRMMKDVGEGGFFMHARGGLETPYLEEEWFDAVRSCIDEAKKMGLHAWCYDEMDWPSGSAGGAVPALGEEYCVRWLRLRECNNGETAGDVIAFYGIDADNNYRYLSDCLDEAELLVADGEKLTYATSFTDDIYLDILNPKAVRAFIDSTYEKYYEKFPSDFKDGTLKGFFTDEPQYALCKTPWSTITLEEFEKTYGYSLKEHIPALLLGRDGHEKVRFDFWKMVNRLYTESFAKQIYEWCCEHDCLLTGHVMMEDNLICQIHCTAGCMPTYEYMHIPGVDWLGSSIAYDRISGKDGVPVIPLQLSSVAAQTGKKHVISETYAMSGWDISFEKMRRLMEWQFVNGVNLICQHLQAYTLRGHRKNDYPPSMFYQSPWWDEYKSFIETEARIGKILADGKFSPDVLMIHPMHSIWMKYTNDDMNAESDIDNKFVNTSLLVAQAHIPYHYGDETIIARHGRVEKNKFIIGECEYTTVLLPEIWGLDRNTFELLSAFAESGGKVILLGCEPTFIDGVTAEDELSVLLSRCDKVKLYESDCGFENLVTYAKQNGLQSVSIVSNDGEEKNIQVCCREYESDGIKIYFFVNLDTDNTHNVKITFRESDIAELCADTMTLKNVAKRCTEDSITASLSFAPSESKLIVAGEGISLEAEPIQNQGSAPLDIGSVTELWKVRADDGNCFLLEFAEVSDGEIWSEKLHAMSLRSKINKLFESGKCPSVKYRFTVGKETDLDALGDVRFVTEAPLPLVVKVNGEVATLREGEWWLDHEFSVFDIGAYLKHGNNEVIISGFCDSENSKLRADFTFGYLVGNFGVFSRDPFVTVDNGALVTGSEFYLGNIPDKIYPDEIVTQGFPFFRGKLTFSREFDINSLSCSRHVDLNGMNAACARVIVNEKCGKLIAWGDKCDDITDRLRKGKNTVEITITVGNRNLLGPHHKPKAGRIDPGPSEFEPSIYEEKFKKRYSFGKAGLGC